MAIASFFRALAGAAHHNALAWGKREVARRADRLTVAALHAAVYFLFHGGIELDVFDVCIGVIVQDDAGVHRVGGIAGPLEFLHYLIELIAVLAAHIRRHGAAGAVFRLEIALGREDQVHHALVETVIATDGIIAFKAVRKQEVDIAVLGVAENDGIIISIAGKEFLQRRTSICQIADRHDDVFQKGRRARRARLCYLGVQTLAEIPSGSARCGISREGCRGLQRQFAQELRSLAFFLLQFLLGISVILNEQRGLLIHIETGNGLRHLIKALTDANRGRVHQLQGGRSGLQKCRQGLGGSAEIIKYGHRGGGQLRNRHRAENRFRNEGQGSFRTDKQVLKKLDRAIKVEEGIETIAHRVFQLEVTADNIHGFLVIAHTALQADKRVHQLRFLLLELPVCIRIGGVNYGAGRQHKGQRFQSVIRIELSAAGHAGGVISHHAADGAGRLAGRIRPQFAVAQA